jgi:hypothetical protein
MNSDSRTRHLAAQVVSERKDPRRRSGRYLEVRIVEGDADRLVTLRCLGVLVMAAKATDGKPIGSELFHELDVLARGHLRGRS